MANVMIIGSGLFGSIAAKLCRDAGHHVDVMDAGHPKAGSLPAGGLMKPSWMTGLGDLAEKGLKVLRANYTMESRTFRLPIGHTEVLFVNPAQIMRGPVDTKLVTEVGNGYIMLGSKKRYGGLNVLVAAGVWSQELVRFMPPIKRLTGSSFLYSGELEQPFIRPWAPYKQLVGFTRDPGTTWCGDGTAILDKNYTEQRMRASLTRCSDAMVKAGASHELLQETLTGMRPYVVGHKKGYFAQVHPKTWVSTGGAKNGTVLAAAQAQMFVEALP